MAMTPAMASSAVDRAKPTVAKAVQATRVPVAMGNSTRPMQTALMCTRATAMCHTLAMSALGMSHVGTFRCLS
jgi:hypothetical protein